MTRIVIVGGGVAGSATAWQAASRGADVVLLEQFRPRHDKGSSHGTSRIFRLAYADELYVGIATRALDLWRRLEALTGAHLLALNGAVDHGPVEVTEALAKSLAVHGHESQLLTPAEAQRRWPQFRFDTSVLFHAAAGRVHPDDAVSALQQAAARAGAEIRRGTRVASVRDHGGTARVTLAGGETLEADVAVIAAGAWLPSLFGDLFDLPALRVTQEQPIHLPAPSAASWPAFIHHAPGGVYGTGSVEGVKIGHHSAEYVVDPDNRDRGIDRARVAALVDYARAWLPGADSTRPSASTCLYTSTADGDFVIDRRGPLVVASPCSGHGFKHGPAIGEMVAALALDGRPAPERFWIR